jgi:hypothetical protein
MACTPDPAFKLLNRQIKYNKDQDGSGQGAVYNPLIGWAKLTASANTFPARNMTPSNAIAL